MWLSQNELKWHFSIFVVKCKGVNIKCLGANLVYAVWWHELFTFLFSKSKLPEKWALHCRQKGRRRRRRRRKKRQFKQEWSPIRESLSNHSGFLVVLFLVIFCIFSVQRNIFKSFVRILPFIFLTVTVSQLEGVLRLNLPLSLSQKQNKTKTGQIICHTDLFYRLSSYAVPFKILIHRDLARISKLPVFLDSCARPKWSKMTKMA